MDSPIAWKEIDSKLQSCTTRFHVPLVYMLEHMFRYFNIIFLQIIARCKISHKSQCVRASLHTTVKFES